MVVMVFCKTLYILVNEKLIPIAVMETETAAQFKVCICLPIQLSSLSPAPRCVFNFSNPSIFLPVVDDSDRTWGASCGDILSAYDAFNSVK